MVYTLQESQQFNTGRRRTGTTTMSSIIKETNQKKQSKRNTQRNIQRNNQNKQSKQTPKETTTKTSTQRQEDGCLLRGSTLALQPRLYLHGFVAVDLADVGHVDGHRHRVAGLNAAGVGSQVAVLKLQRTKDKSHQTTRVNTSFQVHHSTPFKIKQGSTK